MVSPGFRRATPETFPSSSEIVRVVSDSSGPFSFDSPFGLDAGLAFLLVADGRQRRVDVPVEETNAPGVLGRVARIPSSIQLHGGGR